MIKEWDLNVKYNAWLEVELATVKAWNRLGLINDEDCEKIQKNTKSDIARINGMEKTTKHDVTAFLTSVSGNLGEESRFVHHTVTGSDCIDAAVTLQMKESLELILEDVEFLLGTLKRGASEHRNTLMVNKSHGIHGEPTTSGFTVTVWYDEIRNAGELLLHAKETIGYGKISGAVGNLAHAPLELEGEIYENLGLKPASTSNQIIQRNRYVQVLSALAILAAGCK